MATPGKFSRPIGLRRRPRLHPSRQIQRVLNSRLAAEKARNRPSKRKLTDDEKLETFMHSFHAMSQKPYWPSVRKQGWIPAAAEFTFHRNNRTGRVVLAPSPLDPMATDLAGAYMRKLITGTDIVSFGNLLNILKRTFARDMFYGEARHIWDQAEKKKHGFVTGADGVTRLKIDFPRGWAEGQPRDEGPGRHVSLSVANFAKPYFYTGFLHDHDDEREDPQRKLLLSVEPEVRERMAHLAISASLYVATIAHHIIGTNRPELCPKDCQEAAIMQRLRDAASKSTEHP